MNDNESIQFLIIIAQLLLMLLIIRETKDTFVTKTCENPIVNKFFLIGYITITFIFFIVSTTI